jgi:hypothetical protein
VVVWILFLILFEFCFQFCLNFIVWILLEFCCFNFVFNFDWILFSILFEFCIGCVMTADNKDGSLVLIDISRYQKFAIFVPHKGYRTRWPTPKTGYQPTLKTIFVVVSDWTPTKLRRENQNCLENTQETSRCFIVSALQVTQRQTMLCQMIRRLTTILPPQRKNLHFSLGVPYPISRTKHDSSLKQGVTPSGLTNAADFF